MPKGISLSFSARSLPMRDKEGVPPAATGCALGDIEAALQLVPLQIVALLVAADECP